MSGHSHWAGIKHQKGATDAKRGELFSKLLAAIAVAAKTEPNPEFNPRLKAAISKARENKVPADNIARAVGRASAVGANLAELVLEAYGPGGVAILIEALTDSKNGTVAEVKKILSDHAGRWAETGAVRWAFDYVADEAGADSRGKWQAKFPQELPTADRLKLAELIAALEAHVDVQHVFTNVQGK